MDISDDSRFVASATGGAPAGRKRRREDDRETAGLRSATPVRGGGSSDAGDRSASAPRSMGSADGGSGRRDASPAPRSASSLAFSERDASIDRISASSGSATSRPSGPPSYPYLLETYFYPGWSETTSARDALGAFCRDETRATRARAVRQLRALVARGPSDEAIRAAHRDTEFPADSTAAAFLERAAEAIAAYRTPTP